MKIAVRLFLVLLLTGLAGAQDLQLARLGDFTLVTGDVIRDCRVDYRTIGQPNSDKSNAILFTTWSTGTSQDLIDLIGPGKLIDSWKYYVITVDALRGVNTDS